MMKLALSMFAALAISTALPDGVHAQTTSAATLLDRLDANSDGIVSRDEIAAARERLFERLDTNRDGNLDVGEIEDMRDAIMDRAVVMQARLGGQWRRMDANGDGTVSKEEFRTRTLLFDLADRNRDGQLSPAEFSVIRSLLLGRPG